MHLPHIGIDISEEDKLRFEACCMAYQEEMQERIGIGTLAEKQLHAILKDFIEPDRSLHEQASEGFIVDVLNEDGITEIQTAGFNRLRRKIDAFVPESKLRIVYPIPAKKTLSWFDPETGEEKSRRLSPKRGTRRDVLFELYKIRPWLMEKGLELWLYFIDLEEHRLLDGWDKRQKRGSTRVDRLPTRLDRIEVFRSPEDYLAFVPEGLDGRFTRKEFERLGKYSPRQSQTVLRILRDFGLVEVVAKEGRAFVHELVRNID